MDVARGRISKDSWGAVVVVVAARSQQPALGGVHDV
jgi:hypothetical protein